MAQLKNLIVNGVARFVGKVFASEFVGDLSWTHITNKPSSYTPSDHTHSYLPLSGGGLSGTIGLAGNYYNDSYDSGALKCNNSNITGLNSIYTQDLSDNPQEGIHFYRTSTTVDTIRAANGILGFTPNRTLGSSGTEYTVLHSGNYSSYCAPQSGSTSVSKLASQVTFGNGDALTILQNSGSWFQRIRTQDSSNLSDKRFIIEESQGTSGSSYKELFSVDGNAKIFSNGATFSGTVTVANSSDSYASGNGAPFNVGNLTGAHIEIDDNEIMAKASASSVSTLYLNAEGGLVQCGGGCSASYFKATSDINLKENIKEISAPNISMLKAYSYNFKNDMISNRKVGLIAQEVQKILPEAVSVNDDGTLALDYNAIVASLVSVVNLQNERIQALENIIAK